MKNIKVCLRMTTANPFYDDLLNFPPEGVVYKIPGLVTTRKDHVIVRKIKKRFWIEYTKFRPPAVFVKAEGTDLIHSLNGMMILNKYPWIIDAEHVAAFSNFHTDKLEKIQYRNQIKKLLSSEYCKKILPWSFVSKKTIENFFNNPMINEKIEVVYPAVQKSKYKVHREGDRVKLLFIGSLKKMTFYEKGGLQLLKAFEILDKKYDVELTIITNIPEELKNKWGGFNNIIFHPANLTREELLKNYYSKSDIFVFPSFYDTFGGVLLESMSCSLPIVASDIFAIPEIVEDGKNGVLVHPPISMFADDFSIKWGPKTSKWKEFLDITKKINGDFIQDLVEKTSILIEDKSLRSKMGKNGKKQIEKGKFSIEKRNKKLKRIYEESIRC